MSRPVFEGKHKKKAYKACVKRTILNVEHALLTHSDTTGINNPHRCHPEGSRKHLGASCGPSGDHLEIVRELLDTSWELSGSHLGVLWELPGGSRGAFKHLKNMLHENNTSTPLTITIQQEDILLQPGLARREAAEKINITVQESEHSSRRSHKFNTFIRKVP